MVDKKNRDKKSITLHMHPEIKQDNHIELQFQGFSVKARAKAEV